MRMDLADNRREKISCGFAIKSTLREWEGECNED